MMPYTDYDTEPIGDGNPNYRCVGCKTSVPEINGDLKNHAKYCPYRIKTENKINEDYLKFLIRNVLESLPRNRDWLDPMIEQAMKEIDMEDE